MNMVRMSLDSSGPYRLNTSVQQKGYRLGKSESKSGAIQIGKVWAVRALLLAMTIFYVLLVLLVAILVTTITSLHDLTM